MRTGPCADLKTGQHLPDPPSGEPGVWLSLDTFEGVQNYIDELIRLVQQKLTQAQLTVTEADLKKTKKHLQKLRTKIGK